MRAVLGKLNHILDRQDKMFTLVIVLMAIVFSVLEMVSIGVLLPYAEMIVNPGSLENNEVLAGVMRLFNVESITEFLFAFSFVLLAIFVFKLLYSTYFTYIQMKFGRNIYNKLVRRLFHNMLRQPYLAFIKTNSADYTKALLQESNGAVAMIPLLSTILAEFLTIVLLFGLLLLTSWQATLSVSLFFLVCFIVMSKTITKVIKNEGVIKSHYLGDVYRSIDESFGNIKILKLNCQEEYGRSKFMEAVRPYSQVQVKFGTLQVLPRNIIEFIGFGAFIVVVLVSMAQGALQGLLPVLTLFVISFYRMMPSINRIMAGYNQVVFYQRSLEIVYDILKIEVKDERDDGECSFVENIELKDVSFSYEARHKVLDKVSLTIKKGNHIGVVGPSGAGKSTLIDILIGMLETVEGDLLVDGVPIRGDNIRGWRKKIGYIPQSIYLFDGTVAENVCLGFECSEKRVLEVLRKANISAFLETKEGIHTKVGEGGIMLSGGQRQRIGIARALYNDPDVLVMDEATSALDDDTERKIIEDIFDMAGDKTVIMIAHRLSSLKRCNAVYKIDQAKLYDVTSESLVKQ